MFDPHSGGVKISPAARARTAERIKKHATKHYAGSSTPYTRLDIRLRGALCYIDAYQEPEEPSPQLLKVTGETRQQFLERMRAAPLHLCRLRHFAEDRWSIAFFLYSRMCYEPSFFADGSQYGTPEEAFEMAATFLQ